jgi:hypothetical protein
VIRSYGTRSGQGSWGVSVNHSSGRPTGQSPDLFSNGSRISRHGKQGLNGCILAFLGTVHLFFKHEDEGAAPKLALRLMELSARS